MLTLLSLSIKAFTLTSCDQKHDLPAHPTKECQTKYKIKMVKAHQKASLQQVLQLSGSSRELVRSSRDFTYLLLSQCLPIPKTDLTFFYQMIYLKQKEKNAVQKYRNKLKVTKPNENITNLFYT